MRTARGRRDDEKRRKNNCRVAEDWAHWNLLITSFHKMSPRNSSQSPRAVRNDVIVFLTNENRTAKKNLTWHLRSIFPYSSHVLRVSMMIVELFISRIEFPARGIVAVDWRLWPRMTIKGICRRKEFWFCVTSQFSCRTEVGSYKSVWVADAFSARAHSCWLSH